MLDLRTAIDLWLGEQIARREELLEEWYQYSSKCLSLELSETGGQAPSQTAAPNHQGTTPKHLLFEQEQRTCTLTTSSSSSALSRSEPHWHTTARRTGVLKDSGQGVKGTASSTASGPNGSIEAGGNGDSTEITSIAADAYVSAAVEGTDEPGGTEGRSLCPQDDSGKRSAALPVTDIAVQHETLETRSTPVHGDLSQSEGHRYRIGSRMAQIQTNPPGVRYGTVRYYGSVARKEGSWLGIEWDDPLRGKHDGQHEGTRYFTCPRPGRIASFIRVPSGPSETLFIGGVTFLDALEARYGQRTERRVPSEEDTVAVRHTRTTVADIDIEVPNLDKVINKVKQLTRLKTVSLTGPPEHREADFPHGLLPVSDQVEALKVLVGKVGSGSSLEQDARLIGDTVPSESSWPTQPTYTILKASNTHFLPSTCRCR